MSQPLSAIPDDDEDEPTLSYTHSEIQRMREPVVRLEDFAEFGNRGTPEGMVGSQNAASLTLLGLCGEVDESERAAFGPMGEPVGPVSWGLPRAANTPAEVENVPQPRGAANGWAPAQAEVVAAPLVREGAVASVASELLDEAEQVGRRKLRLIGGLGVGLMALALASVMIVVGSGEDGDSAREPSPPELMVVSEPAQAPESGPDPSPLDPSTTGAPPGEETDPGLREVPLPPPDKTKRKAPRPAWQRPACVSKRRTASQAKQLGNWPSVESATRSKPDCWKRRNEHKALRMEALFQLGRLDECIKLGQSGNKRVKTLAKRCRLAKE